jgi:hypothetical protein
MEGLLLILGQKILEKMIDQICFKNNDFFHEKLVEK